MDWTFVEEPRDPDRPYRVVTATTEAELAQVDDLWNAVYGDELGWLPASGGPRYADRYHEHSAYLVTLIEGVTAGTMRLVADSPAGLPVEQFVGIDEIRGDRRLIECQRLMVRADYRNKRWPDLPYGVFGAMVKGCLHWCIRNGFTHILADMFVGTDTTPLGPLRAIGFEDTGKEFVDTELDEPDRSIALLLDVGELFSRSYRSSVPFYRYIATYDGVVDVYG